MDGDRDDSKITDKDMIRIKLPDKVTTILKKGEEGMIWNGILFLDTQYVLLSICGYKYMCRSSLLSVSKLI